MSMRESVLATIIVILIGWIVVGYLIEISWCVGLP